MMKTSEKTKAPTKKQMLTLRIMILIGLLSMAFFLNSLLDRSIAQYFPLYILLVITVIYTCVKILYEWYHYLYITVPETPEHSKVYTVDILTTFCKGEPYAMILETLAAIQNITYPHETYLCDEANDPLLKEYCLTHGIHHVTRVDKSNAKAGNINNALATASGELCVVLDPDHVPVPEFLNDLVSHFDDPGVGFVQIVQAYSNQYEGLIAKGAAQQTYQFYGPIMMTMNRYGTALAIGANCTFRRAALDSIGGHAAGLAEDMHTAMQLHAKGWKSVYVPAVLARGLVPATLSAYYKQQMKWARGVFELFFTSYFKLFFKFNWRQKLHYGLIPLFYLSGFIFLINFLIPIISLFTGLYPIRMDLSNFLVVSFPFVLSMILVRHYVQRWVMEDDERGFHIVGGLLLIGTWWVFNLGFIYTLIRKKIPYIPTPKDVVRENNVLINLPNAVVFLVTLASIVFALSTDWNPYTLIMSGIASINCLIMLFMFFASEQLKVRSYLGKHHADSKIRAGINAYKIRFWLLRRTLYTGVRSIALMLLVLSVCVSVYWLKYTTQNEVAEQPVVKKDFFLTGVFAPAVSNGHSSLKLVKEYEEGFKTHFDIVSFYIPWGNQEVCQLPSQTFDSVYNAGSIPMVTWEPWKSLFEKPGGIMKDAGETKIFSEIVTGKFDVYIREFASQLAALKRPVFLRFAHEADNPFYSWSSTGGNTPEEFKSAWKYVHQMFIENHVSNVIWVWSPWRASSVKAYFPGKDYVDWISVTGLNFGPYNPDKKSYSFKQLYTPFHQVLPKGLPVLIAEMGSAEHKYKAEWMTEGLNDVKTTFPEIKGFVLFNSGLDKNIPDGSHGMIDWRVEKFHLPAGLKQQNDWINELSVLKLQDTYRPAIVKVQASSSDIRGVNYTKGQHWRGNRFALTRKIVTADIREMRKAGINTMKIYGPNIYDKTIFKESENGKMPIHYGFWIPDPKVFLKSDAVLEDLADEIHETVIKYRGNHNIAAWNLANCAYEKLSEHFYQPELYHHQQKYLLWLRKLARSIKQADPKRLITIDVLVSSSLQQTITLLHEQIPEIDSFGLVFKDGADAGSQIEKLKVPYFYSSINTSSYFRIPAKAKGAFIENWQDEQTAHLVSFNGLKDTWGRNKAALSKLSRSWHGTYSGHNLPAIKILRPALTTDQGSSLPYAALMYVDGKWKLPEKDFNALTFEWYLVKTDGYDTDLSMEKLGEGPMLNVAIPENPSRYKLYLVAAHEGDVTTAQSILNIPLKN